VDLQPHSRCFAGRHPIRTVTREGQLSEHVRVQRNEDVLAITLARPDRRNAITVAMYAALADAFEAAATDDGLRLITLSGEGQDFTAGNDLGDFMAELSRDGSDIPVWRLLRALGPSHPKRCA
jgi:enoyl-CoA hydratase/carnithine racemase